MTQLGALSVIYRWLHLGGVYFPRVMMCLHQRYTLFTAMQPLYVQVQALSWHIAIYKWSHIGDDSVVLAMNTFPVSCSMSTVFYLSIMHAAAEWDTCILLGC
jgi:hypothetical protein